MSDAGHTCSYYCHRPDCIAEQRNELRDRVAALEAELAESKHSLTQVKARVDDLINQRDNFSDKYQKALVETQKCRLKSSFYYWGLEAVKTIAITYPQDKAILKAVESAIDSAISAERSE